MGIVQGFSARSTPRRQFLACLQEPTAAGVNEGGDTPNSLVQNKETPKETFVGSRNSGYMTAQGFPQVWVLGGDEERGIFPERIKYAG